MNLRGLEATIKSLSENEVTKDENRVVWALKAMTLTDLTTLSGDDCRSNVDRLCIRACFPFAKESFVEDKTGFSNEMHVAAVCVYPTMVKFAHDTLSKLKMLDKIQIAAGMNFHLKLLRFIEKNCF